MSRRIRGLFNAANFWAIILYNVLALNSLDFAKLVANRLIFKGRKQFCYNKKIAFQITVAAFQSSRVYWDTVPEDSGCLTLSLVCFLSHDRIISA